MTVDEQPAAVRTEGRAGELRRREIAGKAIARLGQNHAVARETEDATVAGKAVHAGPGGVVFAEHQAAAWAHTDVVRHVQHIRSRRLEDQAQAVRLGIDFPHLPHPRVAARGGRDIQASVAEPRAFQTREDRAARGESLGVNASSVLGSNRRVRPVRLGDVDPVDAEALADALPLPREIARTAIDGEHLQLSAGVKTIRCLRNEAIQARTPLIFGFIHDAGRRVRGGRFVHETPHVGDRHGLAAARARHFEHVAMLLFEQRVV